MTDPTYDPHDVVAFEIDGTTHRGVVKRESKPGVFRVKLPRGHDAPQGDHHDGDLFVDGRRVYVTDDCLTYVGHHDPHHPNNFDAGAHIEEVEA